MQFGLNFYYNMKYFAQLILINLIRFYVLIYKILYLNLRFFSKI